MSKYPDEPPSYLEATMGTSGWGGGGGSTGGDGNRGGGFPEPSAPPPASPTALQDELSVWFSAVDEDGNGHITAEELQQALLDENYKPFSLTTCRMLVRMFDDNSNGEIELREFVQLFCYVRDWRNIFIRHDADMSQSIETDELVEALNTVHAPTRFSRQFSDQLMKRFGKRSKGGEFFLSLDGFIAVNAELNRLLLEYSDRPESFLLSRMENR